MRGHVAGLVGLVGACVYAFGCGGPAQQPPPSGDQATGSGAVTLLRVTFSEPPRETPYGIGRALQIDSQALLLLVPNSSIRLELKSGAALNGVVESVTNDDGTRVWMGHLQENAEGRFILAQTGSGMIGNIVSSEGEYEVIPAQGGQILVEVDDEEIICGVTDDDPQQPNLPDPPLGSPSLSPFAVGSPAADPAKGEDGRRVDVLVLYTSAVAKALSPEALKSAIDQAERISDASMRASGVELDIRVVGREEIEWTETTRLLPDLAKVRNSERAKELRDKYRADQVTLLRTGDNPPEPPKGEKKKYTRGIASTPANFNVGFANYAYAVVDYRYVSRGAVFTHELGHTFGAHHDPANAKNAKAILKYAFGHNFVASNKKRYGTMLSYPGTRIWGFSNPSVKYLGVATGVADERDNAQTIRNTKTLCS